MADRAYSELLDELADAGVRVSSASDLINTREPYPTAVPILIDWLAHLDQKMPGPEEGLKKGLRETLIRALIVKEAKNTDALPTLLAQFDQYEKLSPSVLWAAGYALAWLAPATYYDRIAPLAADRRYGLGRRELILWLGKSRNPQAITIILDQLDDPLVATAALQALARRKPVGVRGLVEPYLDSDDSEIRKQARKALGKLLA
ncbi:HEAT repeat domain-containing protein [Nocardia sp. XZ_19_385]|uniref:HEAT repeat domain-containing protein n=1 Tax=Nocardia sp. XZ_19_385 TaxID=2769488 RepID=UPI001890AE6E|nr:HEAT repeat domain-containing protein [Nocardia sp. XZ_19_385]